MLTREIDYERWKKTLLKLQIIVAGLILAVEVADNIILYLTRSQGYGPDTIAAKLLRYLLLPTVINFGAVLIGWLIVRKQELKETHRKYILIMTLEVLCINASCTHYQFMSAMVSLLVPVLVTVLYEDFTLNYITAAVSGVGLLFAVIFRANDPGYNTDIIPETAIVYASLGCFLAITHIIIGVMKKEREDLREALIRAEEAKYVEILNQKNAELTEERKTLRKLLDETFVALSKAVDFNDHYTNGHSKRVAEYSMKIAKYLGIEGQRLSEIYYAGLLHDIGKIGVDNSIINKMGKLTDSEYDIIKMHPTMGYHILKGISAEGEFSAGAKWHHERYDGKGYPDGLSGENIPFIARIIAVADAYDAMTSKRSYRNTMTQKNVRKELEEGKGTQFDPVIADAMIKMVDADKKYDLRQHPEQRKCILIIDCDTESARRMANAMDETEYEFVIAESVIKGLMVMVDTRVDFIFIEADMPGIDGFRGTEIIRRDGYETPIAFISSNKDLDNIKKSKEMDAVDYIIKPVMPNVIKEILYTTFSETKK